MSQEDDRELVLDALDGSLSKEERARLLDRMQADPSFRREVETLQALARTLRELPEEAPPPGFAAAFMAAQGGPDWLARLKALFFPEAVPFGPSLALAGGLACALFFMGGGAGTGPGPDRPMAGCSLVLAKGVAQVNGAPAAGRIELRLEDRIRAGEDFEGQLVYPDGTRIKVKPGSEVLIKSRGIGLKEGGVWLQVTKDLRGFTVETPLALAAVKGTRFGVDCDAEGTTVRVEEGRVEVSTAKESKLLTVGMGAKVLKDFLVSLFTFEPARHTMFEDASSGGFSLDAKPE